MKRCPKCNRTYPDDNQKFCTVDGGRLETAPEAGRVDQLGATVLTNQDELNLPPSASAPDLNKTMASLPPPPTGEIRSGATGRTDNRTVAASFQPAEAPPAQTPPAYQQPNYQPQPPQQQQQQQQQPQQPPAYQPQPPPPQQQQQYQQQYQQPPPQYQPQQQYQQQPPLAPSSAQGPPAAAPSSYPSAQPQSQQAKLAARKGSRTPLILGGVVLLLLLAAGAAYYFLVLNKKTDANANANANSNTNAVANANANSNANSNSSANTNTNTTANANAPAELPYKPPAGTTQFVNSSATLSGKISEHFVPFSFYYPEAWDLNTSISSDGTYFVRVERKLPPNFPQERFTVGWYESNGTYDADLSSFPNLV
ncbi:MAG TPA: hypothetical protein VGC89_22990, partial [Pyrinomonadaceae bacterium]